MGFIVGRAYPIIQSMAKKGDKKAQALIDRLDSMTQDEVDSEVSAIMGGSKGGSKKSEGSKDGKPQLKGKEQKTLTPKGGKEKATLEKTVVPIMPRGGLSKEQQAELDSENTPKSFTDIATAEGSTEDEASLKKLQDVTMNKGLIKNNTADEAGKKAGKKFRGMAEVLKDSEAQFPETEYGEIWEDKDAATIFNNGGMTVKKGFMVNPGEGFQVSYDKKSEIVLKGANQQNVQKAMDMLNESGLENFGVWVDKEGDRVVIDPSSVWVKDKMEAAQIGQLADQDSIVDWGDSAAIGEMKFIDREGMKNASETTEEGVQDNSMKSKFEKLQKDIKFDRSVITFEDMEKVANELGIKGDSTRAELQNMRDGIVEAWAESPNRRENEDGRAAMSAITTTIDYMMNRTNKEMGEPFAAMKTDKEFGPTVSEGEKANRQTMGKMGIDNPEEVAGGVSESEEPKKSKGKLYQRITSQLDGDFGPEHFYDLEDDTIGITPNPGDAKYDATLYKTREGQFALAMFMDGDELNTESLDYFDTPEEAAEYALDTDNYEELKTANLEMEDLQDIDDGENAEIPPEVPAAPTAESNLPSQFKDGNDAAKFGVFMSVKDAIDDDLDLDENEIKQIANEYGVSTKEVSQIIRGYQKRKQGGTQIDTAGVNPAPAGAFGDIEPETQQLAGIGNAEGFKKQMSARKQTVGDTMRRVLVKNFLQAEKDGETEELESLRKFAQTQGFDLDDEIEFRLDVDYPDLKKKFKK
jgi:hypothetical protein